MPFNKDIVFPGLIYSCFCYVKYQCKGQDFFNGHGIVTENWCMESNLVSQTIVLYLSVSVLSCNQCAKSYLEISYQLLSP